MKHLAKIATVSSMVAVLTFAITYIVEWPSWRKHDELFHQRLNRAKEAQRRGEDPFLHEEIVVYCGPTPIQSATNYSFLAILTAPVLLLAARSIRYIWVEPVLHETRSD